jgi:hypothetical protein
VKREVKNTNIQELLLKTEKSITNEILQGQLKTSMRLEKQNGKLV